MKSAWNRLNIYACVAWRIGVYAVLAFFWFAILEVFYAKMAPRLAYLTAHRPIANDSPCVTPECDFSVFWPAGLLARAHDYAALYQPQRFVVWGEKLLFSGAHIETFYYPPQMLLPSALISYLPFEPGFFIWTFGLMAIAIFFLRRARLSWPVIIVAMLSPAALWNTELGQIGVIGDSLLVAGILTSLTQPLRAGGLLGLLVCKPQIGILVPFVFAAQRNWKAFLAFALMCLFLSFLVLAIFGWSVWPLYLSAGRLKSAQILNDLFNPHYADGSGVSIFWMLRSLQASLAIAYAGQAVAALIAAALIFSIWRPDYLPQIDRMALTVFLSLLATPYGYTDDMVGYSIALAALAERRGWRIDILDALFWLWPMLCPVVSVQTGILFTPVIVTLAIIRTWRRIPAHLPSPSPVLPGTA